MSDVWSGGVIGGDSYGSLEGCSANFVVAGFKVGFALPAEEEGYVCKRN